MDSIHHTGDWLQRSSAVVLLHCGQTRQEGARLNHPLMFRASRGVLGLPFGGYVGFKLRDIASQVFFSPFRAKGTCPSSPNTIPSSTMGTGVSYYLAASCKWYSHHSYALMCEWLIPTPPASTAVENEKSLKESHMCGWWGKVLTWGWHFHTKVFWGPWAT